MGGGGEDEARLVAGELAGEFEVLQSDGGGRWRCSRWQFVLSGGDGESKSKIEASDGGSHTKDGSLTNSKSRQKNGGRKIRPQELTAEYAEYAENETDRCFINFCESLCLFAAN